MTKSAVSTPDARIGIQAFLVLDVFVRLIIWSVAFTTATAVMSAFNRWPSPPIIGADVRTAWMWSQAITLWMLLFNVAYVATMVILKLALPNPREGRYELRPGSKIDAQLIRAALIAVLTKARYEAPFPAVFVYQVCCLPPMRWLVGPTIGPRSMSCNVTQSILADPHLITIGKNVVFGYGASVSAHTQDREGVTIARTTIEDEVLIGAESLIYGGCVIKRGAIIGGGAVVRPFTTIGEYEVWGGVPAKKIKDMPPIAAAS